MKHKMVFMIVFTVGIELCFLFYLGYKNILAQRDLKNMQLAYEWMLEKQAFMNEVLCKQGEVLGKTVNRHLKLKNRKLGYFTLEDILQDTTYLFCLPPFSCTPCNEKVLQNIPFMVNVFGDHMKIICHASEMSDVIEYCNMENLYVIENDIEHIGGIQTESPYMLSVSKSGVIKMIFPIPNNMVSVYNTYITSVFMHNK